MIIDRFGFSLPFGFFFPLPVPLFLPFLGLVEYFTYLVVKFPILFQTILFLMVLMGLQYTSLIYHNQLRINITQPHIKYRNL